MAQAHDDSALPKENHETMIRKASEQAVLARAVENGQFYITNEFVMNGNSCTPLCREYSEPRNSQSSRLQAVLTNHCKDWTSGQNWSNQICEGQVPSQQSRNKKSWGANITRNRSIRTTIYSYGDWPPKSRSRVITAVSELRATAKKVVIRQSDTKLRQSESFHQQVSVNEFRNWFQQERKPKEIANSNTSPGTSQRFYVIEVVMKLMEQHDGILVWQTVLSKLGILGTRKVDWSTWSFTDNHRME